jgi:glycine cleavage system aminomethyltransferase T
VGFVSAAEYGHVIQSALALAYVPVELSVPGTQLAVDVLGDRRAAPVVDTPLYDPGNVKLRS